jgi:hypothetical protein
VLVASHYEFILCALFKEHISTTLKCIALKSGDSNTVQINSAINLY